MFTPSGTVVAFIALHTPPRAANAAGLNRHDSFEELLQAWNATGNPAYPTFFSNLVADWVGHLPCREGVTRQKEEEEEEEEEEGLERCRGRSAVRDGHHGESVAGAATPTMC